MAALKTARRSTVSSEACFNEAKTKLHTCGILLRRKNDVLLGLELNAGWRVWAAGVWRTGERPQSMVR